jgi:small-conductance mechanosensitive channel
MPTPKDSKPPQRPNDQAGVDLHPSWHDRSHHPLRVVTTLVGAGLGVILAVAVLSAWRDIGGVATAAITAISATVGAAIGVAALEVRRRSS